MDANTRPSVDALIEQAERMAMRAAAYQEDWVNGKLPATRYAGQDARDDMKGAAALMAIANGRSMADLAKRADGIAQSLDLIASVGIIANNTHHSAPDGGAIATTKAMLLDNRSANPDG